MGMRDPRVDAYIAKSAVFAQPVLEHLRTLVHKNCPTVEESIKWGMPAFLHHGMLANMAAFKQHCTFGFWKHKLVVGADRYSEDASMGQFGRVTTIGDLPAAKVIAAYIKKAAALNEAGVKVEKPKTKRAPPSVPDDLNAALKKNRKALVHFKAFTPGNQREYVDWITEAKRAETRSKRVAQALEWIAEGKKRNWKYENC